MSDKTSWRGRRPWQSGSRALKPLLQLGSKAGGATPPLQPGGLGGVRRNTIPIKNGERHLIRPSLTAGPPDADARAFGPPKGKAFGRARGRTFRRNAAPTGSVGHRPLRQNSRRAFARRLPSYYDPIPPRRAPARARPRPGRPSRGRLRVRCWGRTRSRPCPGRACRP